MSQPGTPSWAQGAAQAQFKPEAPKPLTHEDRITRLESQLNELREELNAVAESHATQLTKLQTLVGGH